MLFRSAAESKLDTLDSLQLVSQAGKAPVGNVVDPNYTFVSKIEKKYLPNKVVYGGVHDRLAKLGAQYKAEK